MNRTINQVAKLTGTSVRALHYYDEIGLLKPAKITETGYRIYNDDDLERLQQILFFKEMGFDLKKIKEILDSPGFDKTEVLKNHKSLLVLKRDRLDTLINLVDKTLKGESKMSFKEFDMTEIEEAQKKYQKEAEERWGETDAYKESAKRVKQYTKEDWAEISAESERIYTTLAANMDKSPDSPEVQGLIKDWQAHITKYFYNCNKDILRGLGQMYISDERFTKNIDKYGKGLAIFMSKAIEIYCG